MTVREIQVPAAFAGERLDPLIATVGEMPRARAAQSIDNGDVVVNGQVTTHRSHRVEAGDTVQFTEFTPPSASIEPDASVEVPIVYEDADLVVVDKPAGLVVHPGAGRKSGTLAQGLLARFPELRGVGEVDRPGIVHRLDSGTSGLLVVARTPAAYESLVSQFGSRTVERRYLALVWGHVESPTGLVDAPVGRSAGDPNRMAVTASGRPARTRYEVLERFTRPAATTELACRLETGRTHQIRVHLSSIGHPVVGDDRYGGLRPSIELARPFLHAATLGFVHPTTGSLDSPQAC